MYYLNSRYYSPEISRFISSDGLLGVSGDIQSTNMYAYTQNNPTSNVDPNGRYPRKIVGMGIEVVVSLVIGWTVFAFLLNVVWFKYDTNNNVSSNGEYSLDRASVYYGYSLLGGSFPFNAKALIQSGRDMLFSNPMSVIKSAFKSAKIQASIGYFLIFADTSFDNPDRFAGAAWFQSFTIGKAMLFAGGGKGYETYGIGVSFSTGSPRIGSFGFSVPIVRYCFTTNGDFATLFSRVKLGLK